VNRYQTTGWAASDDVLAIPVRHPTNGRIVAMQRRILVLGAGFLGAAITRTLIDDGYSVSVLTRATPGAFTAQQLQGARVVVGDVGDWRVASGLIPENDHVVYAVGGSSPADSDLDPANDAATVLAPLVRVLELLRQRPHAAITYLSSGGTRVARSTASPILSRPGRMSHTADEFLRNPEVDR